MSTWKTVDKQPTDSQKPILRKLYNCTTKEQIEAVFTGHGVSLPEDKSNLLRWCTELEAYTVWEPISPEDEYSNNLAFFLDGTWRFMVNHKWAASDDVVLEGDII